MSFISMSGKSLTKLKATHNSTDMTIAVSWYVKQQQNKANHPKKVSLILPCWHETKSVSLILPCWHETKSVSLILPCWHETKSVSLILPCWHETKSGQVSLLQSLSN